MSQTLRTFIALDLDPEIRKILSGAQDQWKALDCDVKWVKPENIHVTLKFLGDVKIKRIEEVKEALQSLTEHVQSFEIETGKAGAFPNIQHPHILWIGLNDEEKRLARLAESIEEKLGSIGFKKEPKPFSPHITIGRVRTPKNIASLSRALSENTLGTPLRQTVNRLTLYQSTLTSQGPVYAPLGEAQFR